MGEPRNDNLANLSNLLNSLKEIESYIITDMEENSYDFFGKLR